MIRPPPRRWVQGLLLGGFLLLFAQTTYRGFDLLDWPVHLILRLDPLALLAELLAVGPKALTSAWAGALLLLLTTVFLGRFFCGWACPLGTILDLFGAGLRRWLRLTTTRRPPASTGVAIFTLLLVASALGLPLLGVLDPLSLTLRTLTLSVHPMLDGAGRAVVGVAPGPAVDPLYTLLEGWVIVFRHPTFLLSGLTLTVFMGIVALEAAAPRFWCAHLCPLGTLLGLVARLGPLGRQRAIECGPCRLCDDRCPTGAAATDPATPDLCLQCGVCAAVCPRGARQPGRVDGPTPPLRARRAVLASAGSGVLLALAPGVRAEERQRAWDFLRPPGAVSEKEFRKRCIRCGACMRVCPRGALHPALLEAGLGGMWTPRFVPRLGYCEYHCRLCGQVCPTGAIGYLEEGEKEKTVIGIAVFDHDRCLPYRKGQECLVCQEHCPTNPKAIEMIRVTRPGPLALPVEVVAPVMVEERCVGCGICEEKCPVPGRAAVRITREKPGDLSSFF